MPLAVNEQSAEIKALARAWPMLDALMAGTAAMRAGSTTYLPRWPAEESDAYTARLATATLFPALRRTVGVMAGKPFSKALTLKEAPGSMEKWAENIDQQGVNLHSFAAEQFHRTVSHGLAGVLVEYPDTRRRDPAGKVVEGPVSRTVAQAEAAGLRPYWVRVRHEQILGWRAENRNGAITLTQLRLLESVDEPDGLYGTQVVSQVRVLYPGGWQVFRAAADGKGWELHDEGRTTLTRIPFVPFYGVRAGFMVGEPPLLDLAYLNVKHWQSQSDQDTILHAARVPILAMSCGDEAPALVIGGGCAVKLPIEGKLAWVEHSGAAIGAGSESLDALEKQMIQTGAELLVKQPGDRSATEAAGDAEGNKCELQRMAEGFEDALDMALEFTAEYARLDKAGSVSLFSDYGAATLSDASATLVKDLQAVGIVSKATVLREMQRRGVIAADVDVDEELAAAEADGPPLGALGTDPQGNPLPPAPPE